MGWFDFFQFSNYSTTTLLLLSAPLVAGLIYKIRQYYLQSNTYEGIDDNETLRAKMEAARLKQQDKYSQFIQEHGETLKQRNEELSKELTDSSKDRKGSRGAGDSSLFDRDYMPLMGGGTGSTYRPAKKRACGPCGGGGCG